MNQTHLEYYTHRIEDINLKIAELKRRDKLFFGVRLLFFISFIGLLVVAAIDKNYVYLYSLIPLFILFLLSVRYDLKNDRKLKEMDRRLTINLQEIEFLNHNYLSQPNGDEFLCRNNQLSQDFSLFGDGSLYQYLNRCSTKMGASLLADNLVIPTYKKIEIELNQQAIQELSEKQLFNEDFRTIGKAFKEKRDEIQKLHLWLESESKISMWQKYVAILFPLLSILVIGLTSIGLVTFGAFTLTLIVGFLINGVNAKRIKKEYLQVDKSSKIIGHYKYLLALIEKENFNSLKLKNLQHSIITHNRMASNEIADLFALTRLFDNCYSLPFLALINPLFQFDLVTLVKLNAWKVRNAQLAPQWLQTISEIDKLISFSIFAFNNQTLTIYPTIQEEPFCIEALEVGHPLIAPKNRVLNSFKMNTNPSVLIVTGANMAGKSTFIRTIASNLILAMNGAPVIASQMRFSPVEILSSIKVQDSQKDNKSYFYAELVGMKSIIERVKVNPKSIVFLDEMLRGTNSNDKQKGSFGFIENLISLNANVVVATHDLAIGELENSYVGVVQNRCFEVELVNNQLHFDYILKNGVSQKLNASFLMKEMGIIK